MHMKSRSPKPGSSAKIPSQRRIATENGSSLVKMRRIHRLRYQHYEKIIGIRPTLPIFEVPDLPFRNVPKAADLSDVVRRRVDVDNEG